MKKAAGALLTAVAVLGLMTRQGYGASGIENAYTLFMNGTLYRDADSTATNLLVSAGTVVAYNVNPADYPGAVFVDLHGGVAYPGFNDSHVHIIEVGCLPPNYINVAGCSNAAAIAAQVARDVQSIPDGEPALGFGFSLPTLSNTWTLADLAMLDSAAGHHELFLGDNLGHNCIVNSMVLSNCHVTATSTVAPGGIIDQEHGAPTGLLRESAMRLVGQYMFDKVPDADVYANTLLLVNAWASFGYTSINDMMASTGNRVMRPQIFRTMETRGVLPLRVNYAYTIYSLADVESATNYVGQDTDMVRFLGVKLFVDGAFGAGQAWTTWTNLQGNNGLHYVFTNDAYGANYNLNRIVDKVDDLRLNIHYHSQGDATIDAILNALDAVIAQKGKLSSVHTIIHVALPRNDQILRMKGFGSNLVATVQPPFWKEEANADYYYGDQMTNTYPIMNLINGGLTVGLSTDFAVSLLSDSAPQALMAIGMTPGRWNPPTRTAMTMEALLKGLTAGSAATTATNDTGTLEIGKKADFVVYNRNLYSMTPEELTNGTAQVISTWVGGKRKYPLTCKNDYDGDGRADVAICRSSDSLWLVALSGYDYQEGLLVEAGASGLTPVPCDYDGDAITDIAFYEPSSGQWLARLSSSERWSACWLGGPPFVAAQSDFDGDALADPLVYREADGYWMGAASSRQYARCDASLGEPGYQPVEADYDGDRLADPAVYHRTTGFWAISLSGSGYPLRTGIFGGAGYLPVSADYDGDQLADPAVYEAASGQWQALMSRSDYSPAQMFLPPSAHGLQPVPADYDGDGRADPAVYHQDTGKWDFFLSADYYRLTSGFFGGPEYQPALE